MPRYLSPWPMKAATVFAAAVASLCPVVTAHAAPSGDACRLLTPAEVAAVLGVEVDAGEYRLPNHSEFCIWREHGKSIAVAKNVQLSLLTAQQYELGKTPLPNLPKAPESGIGDEAYFAKTPPFGFILSVKKGDSYFRVQTRPVPGFSHEKASDADEKNLDEKYKTIDRAIARDILKKL
jgi:hypothetical protein